MLLASIENMQYAVTVDVLHTVMNLCVLFSFMHCMGESHSCNMLFFIRFFLHLELSKRLQYLKRMVELRH